MNPDSPDLKKALAAVASIAAEAIPENTRRAYQDSLRYFAGWHLVRFGSPHQFPLHVDVIIVFITDHFHAETPAGLATTMPTAVLAELRRLGLTKLDGPPSPSTLFLRLAALSKLHQLHPTSQPSPDHGSNPFEAPIVRNLMASCRRTAAGRPKPPLPPAPLSKLPLLRLISHIEETDQSIHGIRDRAILLFAFCSGGRRRSEIADAPLSALTQLPSGNYTFELGRSKTNQLAQHRSEDVKPIAGIAALALTEWLEASGLRPGSPGRIFRSIRRSGRLNDTIDASSIRLMVIRRAAQANLDDYYSAKSLRSGFVTEAATQNIPLLEAMNMTGHKTVKAFMAYYQKDSETTAHVANLL